MEFMDMEVDYISLLLSQIWQQMWFIITDAPPQNYPPPTLISK